MIIFSGYEMQGSVCCTNESFECWGCKAGTPLVPVAEFLPEIFIFNPISLDTWLSHLISCYEASHRILSSIKQMQLCYFLLNVKTLF